MSELEKQLQIKELLDNSPLREKLLELKHWEKTMKVKEKELKTTSKVEEVRFITISLLFNRLCVVAMKITRLGRISGHRGPAGA